MLAARLTGAEAGTIAMGEREPSVEHEHEMWEAFAQAAAQRVAVMQARFMDQYHYRLLSGDVQYFWSLDDATITWSRGGEAVLRGRITAIGSVDTNSGTWLWSWANPSLPERVLGDIDRVRRHGEEHAYPVLVWQSFEADAKPVNQATAVALDLLDAVGLWRDYSDGLELVFAIHDLQEL
jgi:hypothetical protein